MGPYNLAALGEVAFERHGDHEALFFEGRIYSTGGLHDRMLRLSQGFVELGIEAGDRVVVMMSNCPEVGLCYSALWRAGAVITPAVFLLQADDLRHILSDSEAKAIITSPEFIEIVKAAAEGVDSLKFMLSVGEGTNGVVALSSLEDAEPGDIVPREDSDLAALMYTGGTTGRAKGVMISHENLYQAGKAGYDAGYVPGINRAIVPLPLSHSYGLLVTAVGMHAEEPGFAALQRWFDPTNFLELIQDHKIQIAVVVPSMLQMLLAMPLEDHDLSSLRYIVSGASPLANEVIHEIERRIPTAQIREGYGLTETTALVSTTPPDERKLGAVGLPLPGCEIRIVDDDANELPTGEPGEIICRSKMVMQGYWKSKEATAKAVRDGWFYTGDIGTLDEDGYLWILDRKKDLIIRGGFNVYPRDIEDMLVQHPAVAIAGVVGKPDLVKGEEIVAFVQLNPGASATPEELTEFAKSKVGRYKYPREVRIVESVPLTPVFKIDRKKIRTML